MVIVVKRPGERSDAMPDIPVFRKNDRYKASSYRAYNFRLPGRYDTSFWMGFCRVSSWDQAVIAELGPQIGSLRILDVGCATGRLLSSLAQAGAKTLAGADLAPRILEVARGKTAHRDVKIELRSADVEDALPWPPQSFDVAVLTGVLHHLYRPGDALREVCRVLVPGGRLLVVDPAFFFPVRQLCNLALRVTPLSGDFRFYSRSKASRLLEGAGLTAVRSRPIGLWSYFITAVKGTEHSRP
jgi:ubiquinone/menaquinone biosynthesis C-methylase UbiE